MKPTCREAVLAAFGRLENRHHRKEFELTEIVNEVFAVTNEFKDLTIRTHITSRMCIQAPTNHATKFDDLDRIDVGKYRRRIWASN